MRTFVMGLVAMMMVWAMAAANDSNCETENCQKFNVNRMKRQAERALTLEKMTRTLRSADKHWIGDLSFQDLMDQLQQRQLSAEQVMSVYMMRAVSATKEFNCVTEFIPDALEEARKLDRLAEVKGPLHGLPFCVKDDHNIEGMDTTLGYSRNLYHPANNTATIVKILRDMGAVPFCKTNVPQTMMSFGSDNPIYGQTVNPLNKKLTPGGSSSGTGCLVGSKAIHFATGTDAAGSGRIPAHFNGISSLMPTSRRLSVEGITPALPNLVGINTVPALFADKPSTLATIFKALTEDGRQNQYDPLTAPLPWNSDIFENSRPLRIGYVRSMPFFPTMGDTPKVIMRTKRQMEELGHTVVPFDIPDGFNYMKLNGDIIFADGGKHFMAMLQDDQISQAFRTFYIYLKFPDWTRRLAGTIPLSDRIQLVLRGGLDTRTSSGLQNAIHQAQEIRKSILKQMKDKNLDLILTPVMPIPAPRLDDPPNLFLATPYVTLWNLVDFPAGVIPRGIESGEDVNKITLDTSGDIFLSVARQGLRNAVGMPIGVQIVGKPFKEEQILRLMTELEKNFA